MPTLLFANAAILALAVTSWNGLHHWLKWVPRGPRLALFGIGMMLASVLTMIVAVPVSDGIQFDLRLPAVAVAAWFAGPMAGVIAAVGAGAFRFFIGGEGALMGITAIAAAAIIGSALHVFMPPSGHPWPKALILAFSTVDVFVVTVLLLPQPAPSLLLEAEGLLLIGLIFCTTLGCAMVLQVGKRLSEERELLRAAIRHSPHYLYVKDLDLKFVAVNTNVATHAGFEDPAELYGQSDYDIDHREHALDLASEERTILRQGTAIVDKLEQLTSPDGEHWFSTTKRAVVDLDGRTIGLVGVTQDVTEQRALEESLAQSEEKLHVILQEMSDGVAVVRRDGLLLYSNEQYCQLFPRSAALRQPGNNLIDILRASAQSGEQVGIPPDMVETWIQQVIAGLAVEGEQVIELDDGRWLRVRTKPIDQSESLIHVTDITNDRLLQKTLVNLAQQLRALSSTDALTGVANRRAFDARLEEELRRAQRSRTPVSLLMIDVDEFKSYNDTYGHHQGDTCLRSVAKAIASASRRPADFVARYGGEEFAMILGDTDEDGAYQVAERVRGALAEQAISHQQRPRHLVTVSIGIGTRTGDEITTEPSVLIRRADEALYMAKDAGRDRIMGLRKNVAASRRSR